jgi:S1-C subfamily serine protease
MSETHEATPTGDGGTTEAPVAPGETTEPVAGTDLPNAAADAADAPQAVDAAATAAPAEQFEHGAAAAPSEPDVFADTAPQTVEPTVPAGWPGVAAGPQAGWPSGPPTAPGGWPAQSAQAGWPAGAPTAPGGWSGGGWTPPPSGWTPSGGWQPPGTGWNPPPSGWVPPGQGWTQPAPAPSQRRHHWTAALVAVALVALMVGAGVVGYIVRTPNQTPVASRTIPHSGTFPFGGRTSTTTGGSTSGRSTSGSSSSSATGSPSNTAAIAAQVDPGLVDINTTLKTQNEEAAGTGMVLTSDGEVLTNNHVINGATTISVTDIGNGKTYSATVVGYDRTQDVAVLQLKGASGLKTVSTGNSSDLSKGDGVVGIGNAGGVGGTPSVAGGSVTALGQSITASDSGDGTSEKLTDLIQTNCNIQPGDSGGPLVNTSGKVVGMDTAASGSGGGFSFRTQTGQTAANQGFAIPINKALTLAKKIEAGDASTTIHIGKTAFIGVEVTSTSSTTNSGSGIGGFSFTSGATTATPKATTVKGAHVAGVVPNEPAGQAGLAKGDVITNFAGKTVTSATDLTSLLGTHHPGDTIKLTWVNASGQKQSATLTLGTGPAA